ncbi:MAG: TolC family protein [Bacteroidales bacterium]
MKTFFIVFFLTIFSFADAQSILTADDAVRIALKNNYGILIARNDAAILKTNNTAGNAGMLPNVAVVGNGTYDLNNLSQSYSGGTENNYTALSSTFVNVGTELNWTIFDGGKMFITKNKLNEMQALGELQFKDKVLQTQYDVIAAYYEVVRQKQQLTSINEIINYNTELVKILQVSFEAGSLLKTNLLQAKIDLNVYMENSINQEYTIDAAKKNLNQLMGSNTDALFEVSDSIPLNYSIDKAELSKKLYTSNTTLLSFQKEIDIARLNVSEYNSMRYPLINFKAAYYLSHTANSAGNLLKSQSYGPQLGGTISIPVFQSGKINRQISTAKIAVESASFNLETVKLQINNDLFNAIKSFENQQRLLKIETTNNEFTKENLEISLQRMKLGQTTSLEVHQAQENYVQSCTRLINFKFYIKLAETKLKQLLAVL